MRRLIPAIAICLAYAITPGSGEITENVAHYLLDGHAAHAAHDADQGPNQDTHGCSGPFQTCPCHGTTAFVTDSTPIKVHAARVEVDTGAWFVADLEADGVLSGVFRPPIS